VFIYKNGKAKEVKVQTGLRTESNIQIREGLNFGDTLLTTAILQLREGISVQLDTIVTNQQIVNQYYESFISKHKATGSGNRIFPGYFTFRGNRDDISGCPGISQCRSAYHFSKYIISGCQLRCDRIADYRTTGTVYQRNPGNSNTYQ